jgi:hypothetical protein
VTTENFGKSYTILDLRLNFVVPAPDYKNKQDGTIGSPKRNYNTCQKEAMACQEVTEATPKEEPIPESYGRCRSEIRLEGDAESQKN